MNTEPLHINKILEIDFDTERENQLEINQPSWPTRKGRRPLDRTISDEDDLFILCSALAAKILWIEEKGQCKKGIIMQATMDFLGQLYIEEGALMVRSDSVQDGKVVREYPT